MTKGLVLAGGGAKGSYQVGVYKALSELDWHAGVITGTSVGCLNGALFALDNWELAQEMWLTIGDDQVMEPAPDGRPADWGDFVQAAVEHGGMDVTPLEATVRRVVDEKALRDDPGVGLDGLLEMIEAWLEVNNLENFIRAARALWQRARAGRTNGGSNG